MTEVVLSGGEMYVGALVGVARRLSAIRCARVEVYGNAGQHLWQIDIEAALAEMAAAKALNYYWKAPLLDKPAVGALDLEGVNVRSTGRPDGQLIIHARDDDEIPFVLVRGMAPKYELPGWCLGREGKREEFWRGDFERPCFMVPIAALRPIGELRK